MGKKLKETRLYCLKKNGMYIAWDGKTMVERPSNAGRFSRTFSERHYPDFEMLSFPEAYDQWYQARKKAMEKK